MQHRNLRSKLEEIFLSSGSISKAFANYETRDQQQNLAKQILEALDRQTPLLIEAPPGIGKTIGYLVPAALWLNENPNERIIITTGTRALQKQIVEHDAKKLAHFVNDPPSIKAMYGSENYACARRFNALAANSSDLLTQDMQPQIAPIESVFRQDKCFTIHELQDRFRSVPPQVWGLIRRDQNACKTAICKSNKCTYLHEKQKCRQSKILVVNHALFIGDLLAGKGAVLGDYTGVIVDEAHLLDDYAARAAGLQVSRFKINAVLKELHSSKTKKGVLKKLGVSKKDLERLAQDLFYLHQKMESAFSHLMKRSGHSSTEQLDSLSENLKKLTRFINRTIASQIDDDESKSDLQSILIRADALSQDIETWAARPDDDKAYWFGDEAGGTLHAALLSPAAFLKEKLFDECSRIVFLSSTLSTGEGDFTYFRNRLGLDNRDLLQRTYDSPFDFTTQAAMYLETSGPNPKQDEEAFRKHVNKEMLGICQKLKGRTLCLFTSKTHLAAATEYFDSNGVETYSQARMPAAEITKAFIADPSRPILGVASFWTGIDLPDHTIKAILIARIPFDSVADERIAAICKQIDLAGGNSFRDYVLPNATLMLKQGFGRLIRSKNHCGVVCIFDQRIRTMSYGKKLLSSLPKTKILNSKKELENYLNTLK